MKLSLAKRSTGAEELAVKKGDLTGGYPNFLAWLIWMRLKKWILPYGAIFFIGGAAVYHSVPVVWLSMIGLLIFIFCMQYRQFKLRKKGIST